MLWREGGSSDTCLGGSRGNPLGVCCGFRQGGDNGRLDLISKEGGREDILSLSSEMM